MPLVPIEWEVQLLFMTKFMGSILIISRITITITTITFQNSPIMLENGHSLEKNDDIVKYPVWHKNTYGYNIYILYSPKSSTKQYGDQPNDERTVTSNQIFEAVFKGEGHLTNVLWSEHPPFAEPQ
jgi:hypothetical protein